MNNTEVVNFINQNMTPLLLVNDLTVKFKTENETTEVVKMISFAINEGEVLGLVGESGSGKSVTSLAIMRLLTSSASIEGVITFSQNSKSIDLLKLDEKNMQAIRGNDIAMIFQEPMTSLNPVFTVGDQVAEAIIQHKKVSKKEAFANTLQLFKEVDLPRPEEMLNSYPHELSGGQKQRVMIAMALSCNPKLLIADEPTTALDVTVQATIINLLKKITKDRQMSMLFISHDLGVISTIADRVLVMYRGDIVEQGEVHTIFNNPQNAYTKGLLACRPSLTRKLKKLPVLSDFTEVNHSENSIEEVYKRYEFLPNDSKNRKLKLYANDPILKVENLKTWFPKKKGIFGKTYNYVKAVDEVSFEVFKGETLGLVGESGCGKTTLGRSILRLVEPSDGKVYFENKDLRALNSAEMRNMRKRMQLIFQDPYSSLNPKLTVAEAILEPMRVHQLYENEKNRVNKLNWLLDRVGMVAESAGRYPHEFSGGQRQRICIARALAVEPEFIVCDESVSALDVSVQAQVLNLLVELREDLNLTYIFITHDLSVVKFISDRMIVMNQGKIEEMGDPEEIYSSPKSAYTKKLIDAIPGI